MSERTLIVEDGKIRSPAFLSWSPSMRGYEVENCL